MNVDTLHSCYKEIAISLLVGQKDVLLPFLTCSSSKKRICVLEKAVYSKGFCNQAWCREAKSSKKIAVIITQLHSVNLLPFVFQVRRYYPLCFDINEKPEMFMRRSNYPATQQKSIKTCSHFQQYSRQR